jgi:hypothetical protein
MCFFINILIDIDYIDIFETQLGYKKGYTETQIIRVESFFAGRK